MEHCTEGAGVCAPVATLKEAVSTLKVNDDTLFKKIESLQRTAFGLLIAVIVDILVRVYMHGAPK